MQRFPQGKSAALIVLCAFVWWPAHALAVEPDERLADPALEARARGISSELRCLVCQNQSIDDSSAPLARDLRLLVRERLQTGSSDSDVKRYLVDRYGEFVLLKPRFSARNALLWLTPFGLLAGVSAWLYGRARQQGRVSAVTTPAVSLTRDEKQQLDKILSDDATE